MKYAGLVVGLLVLFHSGVAAAQFEYCPTDSYCYYVAPFTPPADAGTHYNLVLASPYAASANVSVFHGVVENDYVVNATPTVVALSTSTGGFASTFNAVESRGMNIVSDQPIVAQVRESGGAFTATATLLMHRMALGTSFRAVGFILDHDNALVAGTEGYDVLSIYAQKNTTVSFTARPSAPPSFWDDGFTGADVALQAGETFIVRTLPGVDITGTLVTATAAIAVSSGGRGWTNDDVCSSDGFVNLVPSDRMGNEYLIYDRDGATTNGEQVYVVSNQDGATLTINPSTGGGVSQPMLAGFRTPIGISTATTRVFSTFPMLVVQQTNSGNDCEVGMTLVPPQWPAASAPPATYTFNALADGEVAVLVGLPDNDEVSFDGSTTGWTTEAQQNNGVYKHRLITAGTHTVSTTSPSIIDFQVRVATDGASAGATTLAYLSPYRKQSCGDGITALGERCDDGNALDFDTCSTTCRLEDGQSSCATSDDCALGVVCDIPTNTCVSSCEGNPNICSDAEQCTADACGGDGFCTSTPVADEVPCSIIGYGIGVCSQSLVTCVQCLVNDDCTNTPDGPGATCDTNVCELGVPTITAPGDGDTTTLRPTYSGTGPAGAALEVFVDGASVGTTTIGAGTGQWTLDQAVDLAVGNHDVQATASAGALSQVSTIVSFRATDGCLGDGDCSGDTAYCNTTTNVCIECRTVVDCPTSATCDGTGTCVLAAPVVTAPADGSHGADTTPHIAGTAPLGATVTVVIDNVNQAPPASVDGSGDWSFDVVTALSAGQHVIRAFATSGSVQSSNSASVTIAVTQDCFTTPDCPTGAACTTSYACTVAAPVVTAPVSGSTLNDVQPTFTGTATAGTTVSVIVDGSTIGTTTTSGSGDWSFAPTATLALGSHTVQATASAGTFVSSASATVTFTIIALPPDDTGNPDDTDTGGSTVGGGGVNCSSTNASGLDALLVAALLGLALRRRRG